MKKLKVVTIDDDPDILEVIEATLSEDYEISKAINGKEAIQKIRSERPDLIVLDYMLPDTEGIEICKELRKDPLLRHLPILMLTGRGEVDDKVRGLESGADDYMVKPFLPQELLARVHMLIRRSSTHLDANPLTRLPGNVSIMEELKSKLQGNDKFALLHIDLDNFKALNDYYGFEKGDRVIKETARIVIESVQKKGTTEDFIGHIGGDDFIVISKPECTEEIAKEIITTFDSVVPKFYEEKDRVKAYIEEKDRQGNVRKFRFLTISIGIVTNTKKQFNHAAEVITLGAEMKTLAKQSPKSTYIFDSRSND